MEKENVPGKGNRMCIDPELERMFSSRDGIPFSLVGALLRRSCGMRIQPQQECHCIPGRGKGEFGLYINPFTSLLLRFPFIELSGVFLAFNTNIYVFEHIIHIFKWGKNTSTC